MLHVGALEAGVAFIQEAFTPAREGCDLMRALPDGSLLAYGFEPFLAGLDREDLANVSEPTCGASAHDLVIGYVNQAWLAFGADNGAARVWGPGERLLDATTEPLRSFFADHFRRAVEDDQPWEHDYQCSSPTLYREFRLRAMPIAGGRALLLIHTLRVERPHTGPGVDLIESAYRAAGGLIKQCAHCRRVERAVAPAAWDWVPEVLARPELAISHGLCPMCSAYYFGPAARGG